MATKSILKNINIKDKRMARNLVKALEYAENVSAKKVDVSKSCISVSRDQIKMLFGVSNSEQHID